MHEKQDNREIIQTMNVTKDFRDFWGRIKVKALDNLNLDIKEGEIFGFLGPNGCGKTTTIKLLLGLLFPSTGKIKIFGKSPRHVANKKRIGFLPEESYLYPYQNAQEALFFYGRLFGMSRKICKKRVEDLLEMVGLQKARTRYIKEYSKGMARRIGIAQALINDPDLVFLDEPTAGLDPIGTREVKDLIQNLKEHRKTVFLSSHLLADVEDICDRIAIMYGGKIQAQGTVDELLSNPSISQISIKGLRKECEHDLLQWLEKKGFSNVSLSTPKEKLETFFLRVVEKARSQKIVSTGAEAGKTMENFFSTPSKEKTQQVIERLLKPRQETEDKLSTAKNFGETEAVTNPSSIIGNLVQSSSEKPEQNDRAEDKPEPISNKTKDVIDHLLQNKKKTDRN